MSAAGDSLSVFSVRKLAANDAWTRDALKERWKQGRVVGLFNLQSEELFNQCQDFCVQLDDDDDKNGDNGSTATPASAIPTTTSKSKKDTALQNKVTSLNDQLTQSRSRLANAKAALTKESELRLKERAARDELEVKLTASHEQAVQQLKSELASERQLAAEQRAEARQLRGELADERRAVQELLLENRQLQRRIAGLQQQEAALVNGLFSAPTSSSIPAAETTVELTLTDHVNQRLLKSALGFDFSRLHRQEPRQELSLGQSDLAPTADVDEFE